MIVRLFIIYFFSMLLLAGCSGPASKAGRYSVPSTRYVYHVVTKGDTLYSIAWQAGYDYRKVARWNNIRWPYRIHPGQRIYLTSAYYGDGQQVSNNEPHVKPRSSSSAKSRKVDKEKSVPKARAGPIKWHWPTKGKVVSYFSASQPGRNGVDIAGRAGQPIKAAASGRVVYSGSGLRGYGNLVIIKHNESYFSAYAHNRRIYVKENQKVKSGEKIADMGSTGANKVMLHFEIRKNGRPINPLIYLPKT